MANLNELKKNHFLYKTTNLLNEKYYVGIHSTSNIKDGYLGSGKRLRYSIRKYSKENFKLEILEFFINREDLVNREKEMVNQTLINDPLCMNLKPGGMGGFTEESCKRGTKKMLEIIWKDPEFRKRHSKRTSDRFKKLNKEGKIKPYNWTNQHHSKETIEKMKQSKNVGHLNSQYNTHWITNGEINKKIKSNNIPPVGWTFGRK